jgi:hypothetical protein
VAVPRGERDTEAQPEGVALLLRVAEPAPERDTLRDTVPLPHGVGDVERERVTEAQPDAVAERCEEREPEGEVVSEKERVGGGEKVAERVKEGVFEAAV